MKGVLFNVVQTVVEGQFGADFWDDALDRAGVDGAYTSLGNYPDAELVTIITVVAEMAGVSRDDMLVLGGRHGFAVLAGRHRELLSAHESWRDVLGALDGIIHPEVRKIYPDAHVPTFDARPGADVIVLEYRSERNLCRLAEGLALGLGDWFHASLSVRHRSCVYHGDDACVLEVSEA